MDKSKKQRPADPRDYIIALDESKLSSHIDFLREACRYAKENSDDIVT